MNAPLPTLEGDISPWPPVLPFSRETLSGIEAATDLAFTEAWMPPGLFHVEQPETQTRNAKPCPDGTP